MDGCVASCRAFEKRSELGGGRTRACMTDENAIQAMVDRETSAWDNQDAETLVSPFRRQS
jgi:hypothetical protein